MLEEKLKLEILESLKTGNFIARDVLKVVLGQIQMDSYNKELTEDNKINIVKKLIKSNQISIEAMDESFKPEWKTEREKLIQENKILDRLLPQSWDETQIRWFLNDYIMQIQEAKSDGQALGLAFKKLKEASAPIDNALVKLVVEEFRKK